MIKFLSALHCMALILLLLSIFPYSSAAVESLTALNNQMLISFKKGKYGKAISLAEKLLQLQQKQLGIDHVETIQTLNSLAKLNHTIGKLDKAEHLYDQVIAYSNKISLTKNIFTALVKNDLGMLYMIQGKFDKAVVVLSDSLNIRTEVLGSLNAMTADAMHNLGIAYRETDHLLEARKLFNNALAIRMKLLPKNDLRIADSYDAIALLYAAHNKHDEAIVLHKKSINIKATVLRWNHPSLANSYNGIANSYLYIGQYNNAESMYKKAFKIRQLSLGPIHADIASSYNSLGSLYSTMGDGIRAESMFMKALKMQRKIFGDFHPLVAKNLLNLGDNYRQNHEYDKAQSVLTNAIDVNERVHGKFSIATATSVFFLGKVYRDMGSFKLAEVQMKRALKIFKKRMGYKDATVAGSLHNLGMVYMGMRQYSKADKYFQESWKLYQVVFSEMNPAMAVLQNRMAVFYGYWNKPKKALSYFRQAASIEGKQILNIFSIASEEQRLGFLKRLMNEPAYGFHASLSLVHHYYPNDQKALRTAFDMVLDRKGIVFDAQSRQQQMIANTLDPLARKKWGELNKSRAKLSKLLLSKIDGGVAKKTKSDIDGLQHHISQLEHDLADSSKLVAQQLEVRKVTSQSVANNLAKSEVLAEFIKIQDWNWENGEKSNSYRYLVFVLNHKGHIRLVDLGDAEILESKVKVTLDSFHDQSVASTNIHKQLNHSDKMYQTLWQPISLVLNEEKNVILSPDGILNLLPFAALRDDSKKFLAEKMNVSYVTSGRDLIRSKSLFKAESELVLVANPTFEMPPLNVNKTSIPAFSSQTRSADFSMYFPPLPGTLDEAKRIPHLIRGKNKKVLSGKDATEENVMAIYRPRILHLATHGFFLKDQMRLASSGTRGIAIKGKNVVLPPNYENPLVRSGLALAGANYAMEKTGSMDGLLTALEVSGMDLNGTELVTLSACETGSGEVKAGEGVFGLRRAFAISGARSLLMSLWPVLDDVTAQQMYTFYNLYGKGEKASISFRNAQIETIKSLRQKYGVAPPSHWAPFILQGR